MPYYPRPLLTALASMRPKRGVNFSYNPSSCIIVDILCQPRVKSEEVTVPLAEYYKVVQSCGNSIAKDVRRSQVDLQVERKQMI